MPNYVATARSNSILGLGIYLIAGRLVCLVSFIYHIGAFSLRLVSGLTASKPLLKILSMPIVSKKLSSDKFSLHYVSIYIWTCDAQHGNERCSKWVTLQLWKLSTYLLKSTIETFLSKSKIFMIMRKINLVVCYLFVYIRLYLCQKHS